MPGPETGANRERARCGLRAPANPGGAGLLAGAGVPVQRASLDRLVDRRDELAVLGLGGVVVVAGDGGFEAVEVSLDARRVAPVLETLAGGALDALLL
jgi:hypothetical protein